MNLALPLYLLVLFLLWLYVLARVHREFKGARDERGPMTLTFYTLGIGGVLLLLGRRLKDPVLSRWARKISGESFRDAVPEPDTLTFSAGSAGGIHSVRQAEPPRTEVKPAQEKEGPAAARAVLQGAIRERAADVHLEPEPNGLRVRYRVDGVLQPRGEYPAELAGKLIAALKVRGGLDISEKRRPQEGSFEAKFGGRPVDFRLSTVGTSYGEKMVVRILDSRVGMRKLETLGLRRSTYEQLHSIVTRQHGMLVVCGPTGSGKTTTLYAALQEVDRTSLNAITLEQPVEYTLEGATQHNVDEKTGVTFASLLRTALHQDPDVLMVGEMRDQETAEIAMQAAMTGHFVYTTVHAHDTVSGLFRLLSLLGQPYAVATSVTAVLAQRLLRRLCTACRQEHKPTAEELEELHVKAKDAEVLYVPTGGEKCYGRGYNGLIGVFELLVLNDELRSLLQAQAQLMEVKAAARRAGLVPLRMDAIAKAVAGVTSVEEALRVTS